MKKWTFKIFPIYQIPKLFFGFSFSPVPTLFQNRRRAWLPNWFSGRLEMRKLSEEAGAPPTLRGAGPPVAPVGGAFRGRGREPEVAPRKGTECTVVADGRRGALRDAAPSPYTRTPNSPRSSCCRLLLGRWWSACCCAPGPGALPLAREPSVGP